MKKLYIIRHGKSSWDFPHLKDIDRPLKKRGIKDAHLMGKLFKNKHIQPELIVSSPAVRAHEAAKIIAGEIGYPETKIAENDRLYFSGVSGILDVVKRTADDVNSLFIFGHNPDFTSLANCFSENYIDNVPTCGTVCVNFEIESWKEVTSSNGSVEFFEFPSKHR